MRTLIGVMAVGARRRSMLKELTEFLGTEDALFAFVRRFAGTRFTVPGPAEIKLIQRDIAIARELRCDSPADERVRLCQRYAVDHAHLAEICRVVHDKALQPCGAARRINAIEEAKKHIAAYPAHARVIADAYEMSANERRQCGVTK